MKIEFKSESWETIAIKSENSAARRRAARYERNQTGNRET